MTQKTRCVMGDRNFREQSCECIVPWPSSVQVVVHIIRLNSREGGRLLLKLSSHFAISSQTLAVPIQDLV
ncbi:hypothetical protein VTL71DRAFT_12834 [Oculimacula yallundae]|uniref:Uncharacterized protein n=1 Tax=Oculimacula yallundae TaxID=86028 RepID=A0ABR4CRA1_9HELO